MRSQFCKQFLRDRRQQNPRRSPPRRASRGNDRLREKGAKGMWRSETDGCGNGVSHDRRSPPAPILQGVAMTVRSENLAGFWYRRLKGRGGRSEGGSKRPVTGGSEEEWRPATGRRSRGKYRGTAEPACSPEPFRLCLLRAILIIVAAASSVFGRDERRIQGKTDDCLSRSRAETRFHEA